MSHRFVGGWALLSASAAAMFGVGWLLQDVTLPLWALIALVFVPAERTISLMTALIEQAEQRATGDLGEVDVDEPRRRE